VVIFRGQKETGSKNFGKHWFRNFRKFSIRLSTFTTLKLTMKNSLRSHQ